jgi:hypothetical protein
MSAEKINPENISPDPLTRIHDPYTLFATPAGIPEADAVIVQNFLQTLAEVALAVAARKDNAQEVKP